MNTQTPALIAHGSRYGIGIALEWIPGEPRATAIAVADDSAILPDTPIEEVEWQPETHPVTADEFLLKAERYIAARLATLEEPTPPMLIDGIEVEWDPDRQLWQDEYRATGRPTATGWKPFGQAEITPAMARPL